MNILFSTTLPTDAGEENGVGEPAFRLLVRDGVTSFVNLVWRCWALLVLCYVLRFVR
jgi:hypothetical protein